MLEFFSSILTTVSDLFGGNGAPWIIGAYAIGVIGIALIVGPILYWIWRPDPTSELAKAVASNNTNEPENPALADALRLGHVGEEVSVDDPDEEIIEAYDRKIISWNGYGRVSGIDSHGHFFTGQVVHKEQTWRGWEVIDGGWVLVQKDRCHRAVWCSYEKQTLESLQIPA